MKSENQILTTTIGFSGFVVEEGVARDYCLGWRLEKPPLATGETTVGGWRSGVDTLHSDFRRSLFDFCPDFPPDFQDSPYDSLRGRNHKEEDDPDPCDTVICWIVLGTVNSNVGDVARAGEPWFRLSDLLELQRVAGSDGSRASTGDRSQPQSKLLSRQGNLVISLILLNPPPTSGQTFVFLCDAKNDYIHVGQLISFHVSARGHISKSNHHVWLLALKTRIFHTSYLMPTTTG
ncbi:hypothetical protein TIFTF001_012047 [Ficus carica]|uniref:Uncharacterized protein n=1 Tax=Ficus carica TaxID=3494 RepID=A0AA87ZST7_FICCA|nr:hypothetical protein TIFTF001_012047 [Ficus carica]